jgi:GTPase Era involved in 16S rRNA processing
MLDIDQFNVICLCSDVLHTLSQSFPQVPLESDGSRMLQVAILGPANAGKSSIVNALVGKKVCVVSPRAQTTRERVLGVVTNDGTQIAFSDTPGVVDKKHTSKYGRNSFSL